MDMSKLKEVYKSYSSLLVPFIVLLFGAIFLVPAQLMSRNLRQKVQAESVRMGNSLQSLTVWPRDQWEKEKERQDAYQEDADQIDFLARQSSKRQLLSDQIFPEPKYASGSIFDDFGQRFRNAVDALVAGINAGDCPTQAELDMFRRSSEARRPLRENISEVDAAIEDNLCREKAERSAVYVKPRDLDGYEFWEQYSYYAQAKSRDEGIRNCWYSQLAYWIIEDVVDTAGTLNSESSSVFTSPVKRLLSVTFPLIVEKGKVRYVAPRSKEDEDVLPDYILSPRDGFTLAYTRRVSDSAIDIVHFKVEVVVGTDAVLSFMKELCSAKKHLFKGWDKSQPEQVFEHNQITILKYDIDSVRRDDGTHSLYRYGEDAIVKLSLICEYIFDAKAYDEVKPKAVKDQVTESLNELKKASMKGRGSRRGLPRKGAGKKTKSSTKEDVLSDL